MTTPDCPKSSVTELTDCPMLAEIDGMTVRDAVFALLGCRNFTWDVLMEGSWSGCHRKLLRLLKDKYGVEPLRDAFGEDEQS